MLDGRLRPCEKRYIAGYEPEYEECRLKFREMIDTHPKPLPKTPASPDFFLLVSQPAHKCPLIEHPPSTTSRCHSQEQVALWATYSQQCSSPTSAVHLVKPATLEACSGSHARVRVSSSSTEKTQRHSRDVDHLVAQ